MQSAENREKCYTARDNYFECVVHKGVDNCEGELALYSEFCPASWKSFFDRQRERQLVLEGQAELARSRRSDK